jgi:hypothetical protein
VDAATDLSGHDRLAVGLEAGTQRQLEAVLSHATRLGRDGQKPAVATTGGAIDVICESNVSYSCKDL